MPCTDDSSKGLCSRRMPKTTLRAFRHFTPRFSTLLLEGALTFRITLPPQERWAEAVNLERRLSDLVNEVYGLTSEEVGLLWATAPPRMPEL